MKDSKGHGSNAHGAFVTKEGRGVLPSKPYRQGRGPNDEGGQPVSSNAQAAQELFSTLKGTQAPVHDAFDAPRFKVGARQSNFNGTPGVKKTFGKRGR